MQKMKFAAEADKVLKPQQQKFLDSLSISVLGTFAMILFSLFVCLLVLGCFFGVDFFFFFSYFRRQ